MSTRHHKRLVYLRNMPSDIYFMQPYTHCIHNKKECLITRQSAVRRRTWCWLVIEVWPSHWPYRMTQDVQLYSPDGVLYTGYNASIQLVYTHTAHSSLGSQNLLAFIEATSRLNKVTSLINHWICHGGGGWKNNIWNLFWFIQK